jgi:hypothetical protein
MKRLLIGSVLALTALALGSNQLAAEGALAIGTDGNVAADGVAVGYNFNDSTSDEASATALKACRNHPDIPKAAAQCKIVGTFAGKCFAVAFDPKTGTPGAGWAIEANLATAKKQALTNCQATAGKDRIKFCQVRADLSSCDKHN